MTESHSRTILSNGAVNHQGKFSVGHFKCGGSADNSNSRKMLRHNVVRIIASRRSICPVCVTSRPEMDSALSSCNVHIQKPATKPKFRIYRAIFQAVIRQLSTATVRVRPGSALMGLFCGQSGIGTDFLRLLQFPLSIQVPYSSITIIATSCRRSNSGRRTKWTHFHPTLWI
jgi:hypothetical protein